MDGKVSRISPLAVLIAALLTANAALAADENFDAVTPGMLPADWVCGVTGNGSPVWKVEADRSAPTQPNVLKQSGSGTFPHGRPPSYCHAAESMIMLAASRFIQHSANGCWIAWLLPIGRSKTSRLPALVDSR
jgi:hypothetical protein